MGAWGVQAFDNDSACDWAYGLEEVDDLSLIEAALDAVDEDEDYVDADVGTEALAACEVIARLRGASGLQNAHTEPVDQWVKTHPLKPSAALVKKARAAIKRIRGQSSELHELWAENKAEYGNWVKALDDLSERIGK